MTDFDRIVDRWHLKRHPFYTAWSAGTLPPAALRHYASEWAAFIALVPTGWAVLGEHDHAAAEVQHSDLWREFAREIGAEIRLEPTSAGARSLVCSATSLFARRATAIGALYAFEAQQPETAAAKRTGLRDHYAVLGTSGRYFAEHAGDYGEAALLDGMSVSLTDAGREQAAVACAEMGRALWDALSDVQATA